jgi:hypothetical protein
MYFGEIGYVVVNGIHLSDDTDQWLAVANTVLYCK